MTYALEEGPQPGVGSDPLQPPQSLTQRPGGLHHQITHYIQGFPYTQLQCPEAQDVHRPSLNQDTPSTVQVLVVQLNSRVHVDDPAVVAKKRRS